jgi:hypothetical protein
VGAVFYHTESRLNAAVPLNGDQLFVSFLSKCGIITQDFEVATLSRGRRGRLRNIWRPDILENVSLRNELLCWSELAELRCESSKGQQILTYCAWQRGCAHTHTHTHRTSDVRGIMARAFIFSRMYNHHEVLESGGIKETSLLTVSYVTLSAALCIRSSSVTR